MSTHPTDYYDHPLFHPTRLRLATPAMARLTEDVRRWIWTGATGGVVLGPARAGKTTALDLLESQLYTRGKVDIPTLYISIPERDQHTITSVFRNLCLSVGLRADNRDRADYLSERYIHYVADEATGLQCDQVALLVDEVQRLTPEQFNAFAEVYDNLRRLGIALTIVFAGDDLESQTLLEKITEPRFAHIRGRFFTHQTRFHGLRSRQEVEQCLAQYDTLRYPAHGPTYSEFALPEAVHAGWKVASLGSELWRIFSEGYQRKYRIDSWGMQYFTTTVTALLIDYLPQHGVEAFDEEMVHASIRLSQLVADLAQPVQ